MTKATSTDGSADAEAQPIRLPEFVPLPPNGKAEFHSGLKRGILNTLILPCDANGHHPPVRSISLRRPGCLKGKRLIHLESLLEYLREHLVEAPEDRR